ncbi:MAG TPA: cupin domain-containing protein [Terracidiphilus sp.]
MTAIWHEADSRRHAVGVVALLIGMFGAPLLHANDRKIDPTFLYRDTSAVGEKKSDITTKTCHYRALFGQGDSDTSVVVGIARYGEAVIDPNGICSSVQYPDEDEVYVVLEGTGSVKYGDAIVSLKKEDYLYIPSTIAHTLSNKSELPLTVIIMGFRTKGFEKIPPPPHPLKANIEDVPTTTVSGHPDSTRYRLLMGDIDSKRDRIAAGAAF